MRYSQLRAMWAITVASLRSILRSPSAIVFSFVFPFIFILIFGFIGNSGSIQSLRVAVDAGSDTTNELFTALKNTAGVKMITYPDEKIKISDLQKGRIAGVIRIEKSADTASPYQIQLKSATSSNNKWPFLKALIESKINELSNKNNPGRPSYASFNFNYQKDIQEIRQYKTIDFILPGMLGFSLLSSGVFGVAFMFFNLRSTLVLKRFFATPISRTYIILGECISRVIFQMITAIVIIGAGYLFFGFTLIHGIQTFLEMLFLSFIGLILFMGFGFIISGLSKNDSTIPPFANLITMPQFLLGGTFFSAEAFPKWLQPISKAMPLTHLNTAMRNVAFEGQTLWDVRLEIGILLLWAVIIYAIAIKVFKWE
ncbi:MAG: ABC transporter permease [Ferruginibacter sp.]